MKHFEGIAVVNIEQSAQVGYWHSFLYFWLEYFLSHNNYIVNHGVGDDPPIGNPGKFVFCSLQKLVIVLDPFLQFGENIDDWLLSS